MASRFIIFVRETGKTVVVAMVFVWLTRSFIAQPFVVRGASMEPNFENREYLIINEIGYRFNSPQRGDIIVFRYPLNPSEFFIKRLIGLPNETVAIESGKIRIANAAAPEGFQLQEPYLAREIHTVGKVRLTLRDDEYFVLGDNRAASSDSRTWGALQRRYIIGKAWVRTWPLQRLSVIETPRYQAPSPRE